MLTRNARIKIREAFNDIDSFVKELHCPGKILFNFQINTTIDLENPFKRDDKNYEDCLAAYFIGGEAKISDNGGGLVIMRGATGSGKTTAIKTALDIAAEKLKKENLSAKIDPIFLQFNNISSIDDSKDSESVYIWREFASEIDRHMVQRSSLEDSLDFLYWLRKKASIRNQMPNVFRYFEKNSEYLHGVKSELGYATFSVAKLREILIDDWRNSFQNFSDEELAKHKIARLRFDMENNQTDATHRVVIIDNVDHLPPSFQVKVVESAIWLAEFLSVRMLIAVRPLTWENLHGHRTLDVEEHLSPSLADVICARLSQLSKNNPPPDPDVARGIQWLTTEIRDERSHLRNLLYGTSGVGVRAALRNFFNFLSSPILDASDAQEHIRPSELARAYFFGAEQSIDHENIDDIFSVKNVRSSHITLLKPRIIDYIARVQGGRVNLEEIFEFIQCFGFSSSEITRAIDELLLRKRSMIWSNAFVRLERRTAIKDQAMMAISPIGMSYYSKLFGEYLYTEACLASTRRQIISPTDVVEFSRRLIIEDENQIENFLSNKSAIVYYSAYGLDFPSISFAYWKRFEKGAFARQRGRIEQEMFDPGWESRIRGFLQGKTGKKYLDAQKA